MSKGKHTRTASPSDVGKLAPSRVMDKKGLGRRSSISPQQPADGRSNRKYSAKPAIRFCKPKSQTTEESINGQSVPRTNPPTAQFTLPVPGGSARMSVWRPWVSARAGGTKDKREKKKAQTKTSHPPAPPPSNLKAYSANSKARTILPNQIQHKPGAVSSNKTDTGVSWIEMFVSSSNERLGREGDVLCPCCTNTKGEPVQEYLALS